MWREEDHQQQNVSCLESYISEGRYFLFKCIHFLRVVLSAPTLRLTVVIASKNGDSGKKSGEDSACSKICGGRGPVALG